MIKISINPEKTFMQPKYLCKSLLFCFVLISTIGNAADNLIDHKLPINTGGIYRAQNAVPIALGAIVFAGALWEGSEDRLGSTFWKSSEAFVASGVLAEGLKRVTGRESPSASDSANNWFKSSSNGSFPSAHVTVTAAAVTPFIMEYKDDHPWVMALAALPAYEMVARVKAQEHWQSDVLAGGLLGVAVGVYEQKRDKSWFVTMLPKGAFIGFRKTM